MRNTLFGIMALAAAGMLASGPALAETMISVGGHFNAGVALTNQDQDEGLRNHSFDREAEIYFRGSKTLDNGITVGVNVELEAEPEAEGKQIDESYLFFSGSFGTIRLGADDGAMEAMGVYPAGAGHSLYGVLYPTRTHVAGAWWVGQGAFGLGPDYDSEKVKWQSPRVGGATVAVSYTPENGQAVAGIGLNNAEPGKHAEVVAAGGNWNGEFAGGNVTVGGGYAQATLEAPSADGSVDQDRAEWIVGASASMQGFTVSGNYSEDDEGMSAVDSRTTIAVGGSYSMAPWKVGVTFANTERHGVDGSAVSLGARYSIGPGVTLAGEIQFWDIDAEGTADDNQATVGLIGTMVSF